STATSSWSMPSPFDTGIGTNFTVSSCPKFLNKLIANETMIGCHAVSMLLETSDAFFEMLTSAVDLTRVLQKSCSVSVETCSEVLTDFASNLVEDSACGQDYELGNPVVKEAYRSMVAYEPVYRATCLINPSTEDYCFVDAALNTSNIADYYVYFLPLGTALTSSNHPTCNKCLQADMTVFSEWAEVKGQPLTSVYLAAAAQVDERCGDDFATTNITVASKASINRSGLTSRQLDIPLLISTLALSLGVAILRL
ncbi:hypothetical protein ASPZODRAFT_30742, partial [Penicilliopsis zonata CBS 506.65]